LPSTSSDRGATEGFEAGDDLDRMVEELFASGLVAASRAAQALEARSIRVLTAG